MASLKFNWKLVQAESITLKQYSEQRDRQFSEFLRSLKMWECLSEEGCSRMRMTTSCRFKCVPQNLGSLSIHLFKLLFFLITHS